jgi:hypothetical protein
VPSACLGVSVVPLDPSTSSPSLEAGVRIKEITGQACLKDTPAHDAGVGCPAPHKRLFISSYAMRGTPALMVSRVTGLDYSVAKGGKLAAYRGTVEQMLAHANLVHV